MSKIPTILIVEDQPVLRTGLKVSLETLKRYQIVGEAVDGEAAILETQRLRPDVVLMDIGLPSIDGIEATWKIKQLLPHTRVVMFTSSAESDDVTAALGAGADGYCTKDTSIDQVANAIEGVMRGETWLHPSIAASVVSIQNAAPCSDGATFSERDMEILTLIKEGRSNREIAQHLGIGGDKVVNALRRVIQQLVAQSAAAAVVVHNPRPSFSKEWFAALEEHEKKRIFADKYMIEQLIGSGGMGAVFKAKHLFIDRPVALKLLRRDSIEDPIAMRNFQREAKAVASLQHPNIIVIYDFGLTPSSEPYLVMEYVPGTDLSTLRETEQRFSVRRFLGLCVQICAGLDAAHAKNIVHCDLKPSNILISGTEPTEVVKLLDFGLAQVVPRQNTPQTKTTERNFACGTPLYMSPEQSMGNPVDSRCDIYSLGCVMFEGLTGVNPFRGESVMETFARQIQMPPPLISSVYPQGKFPIELIALVNRMIAKLPEARPQSVEEVRQILLHILGQLE
jgi:DNA-binding NarL/FixJ family response regulator/tRNA A-37 threonylcarbamoyl transferase component Bud32